MDEQVAQNNYNRTSGLKRRWSDQMITPKILLLQFFLHISSSRLS